MKKIAFISQPEYFRFIYEHDLDDAFEVREFPFHFYMSEEELQPLVDFDADYNVFFRGEFFPGSILKKITGTKIALSSEPLPRQIEGKWEYTRDSVKRYLLFRNFRGKSFDYVFHYDKSSLPLFETDGFRVSGEFAFPVALKTYAPAENIEKAWDIFFIGRSTSHREAFFGSLKHHLNFLHIAHGMWGPSLVEYMHKSKICLNAHAEDEISWEPRMQMMLASGAFVMSERITPNQYLRPNVDYVEYSSPQELFEKASFYLKNDAEREKITRNAMESVRRYFDTKKVFPDLFAAIENGECQKFAYSKGSLLFDFVERIQKLF